MAVLKVKELPQDEKEKLIAEAQELNIRGLLDNYGVETLKKKIQDERAKQTGEGGQSETDGESNGETDGDAQTSSNDGQTPPENEQDDDKQSDGENEQNNSNDEQDGENVNNENPIADEDGEIETTDPKPVIVKEYKICHICRSKVIDGKCTGCGFTL